MYLDYQNYLNKGGSLNETAFNKYEYKAEKVIDYHTYKRLVSLSPVPDNVQWLTYELIEMLLSQASSGTTVTSESNDGTSIHYKVKSETEAESEQYALIKAYLSDMEIDGVPVLYSGVYHA